jgi:hypothetical protein
MGRVSFGSGTGWLWLFHANVNDPNHAKGLAGVVQGGGAGGHGTSEKRDTVRGRQGDWEKKGQLTRLSIKEKWGKWGMN